MGLALLPAASRAQLLSALSLALMPCEVSRTGKGERGGRTETPQAGKP